MINFTRRRLALYAASLSCVLLLLAFSTGEEFNSQFLVSKQNDAAFAPHRKLLHLRRSTMVDEPDRVWGNKCSRSDIVIEQGPTPPLPSGIPTYTVEVMNVCVTGCDISDIHFSCGWFSSARTINPRVFRRLRFDDCLVNGGQPLLNGHSLSFQYANSFPYRLSVSSVVC